MVKNKDGLRVVVIDAGMSGILCGVALDTPALS